MRTPALISCFLLGSAAFAQVPVTQAQAQDWRFAHPGATLIGGFRVKAVLDSPLVNNLIAQATITIASALNRTESRGAHFREDFPERVDDWMKHTLAWDGANVRIDYRPVRKRTLTPDGRYFPPERQVR